MLRYGLVCLLLGILCWGQAAKPSSAPTVGKDAASDARVGDDLSPTTPVITIDGLCQKPPAGKSAGSDCKIVITRAEFEKVIEAVRPGMPARVRAQFANNYARALVMSDKAVQLGLDQGPIFEEKMKMARIQILNAALNRAIKERASQVSDKDIEGYYNENISKFETVDLERVYIPRTLPEQASGTKQNQAEQELAMGRLAEKLRERAAAGEDFAKLQADAYVAAGMESAAPGIEMEQVTRSALPPNQVLVFDLKPGEISAVIEDQSGYFLYKVKSKSALSLDKVRDEIRDTLRAQRTEDELRKIQESAKPTLNESYFASPPPQQSGKPSAKPLVPDPDDD